MPVGCTSRNATDLVAEDVQVTPISVYDQIQARDQWDRIVDFGAAFDATMRSVHRTNPDIR